jgi:hypothetical protein
MIRSMVFGLVLLVGVASLAVTARAGFTDPWDGNQCPGIFGPVNALDDPNTFVGRGRCLDLCKNTAKDCAKYTKGAFACAQQAAADQLDARKKECANAMDDKGCKVGAQANADGIKALNKEDRDSALASCESWGTDCISNCLN